jgi:hypothetical protein
MAVSANQPIRARDPEGLIAVPVIASTTLYQGTLAFAVAASGHASNVIAAGANSFLGIVKSEADNSSGAAAAISAEIYTQGQFELQGSGFTQALVGDLIYAVDNFAVNATSTNQPIVGKCLVFISSTKIIVDIAQRSL